MTSARMPCSIQRGTFSTHGAAAVPVTRSTTCQARAATLHYLVNPTPKSSTAGCSLGQRYSQHMVRHEVGRHSRSTTVANVSSCFNSNNAGSRLEQVLQKIDELNSKDPRTTQVGGRSVPYELAYSRWLTSWVQQLTSDRNPPPSEELLIVARGQHVQRWVSPRAAYPEGRAGYLKWREDLKRFHATIVIRLMREAGYDDASISKVERLMLKKDLKDPESQVMEDALCLVFLQHQFAEFRLKESDDKMVGILRKAWGKMGPKGRAAAGKLPLDAKCAELVGRALGA